MFYFSRQIRLHESIGENSSFFHFSRLIYNIQNEENIINFSDYYIDRMIWKYILLYTSLQKCINYRIKITLESALQLYCNLFAYNSIFLKILSSKIQDMINASFSNFRPISKKVGNGLTLINSLVYMVCVRYEVILLITLYFFKLIVMLCWVRWLPCRVRSPRRGWK